MFKDSDDTHASTRSRRAPRSPAGGYYVMDEAAVQLRPRRRRLGAAVRVRRDDPGRLLRAGPRTRPRPTAAAPTAPAPSRPPRRRPRAPPTTALRRCVKINEIEGERRDAGGLGRALQLRHRRRSTCPGSSSRTATTRTSTRSPPRPASPRAATWWSRRRPSGFAFDARTRPGCSPATAPRCSTRYTWASHATTSYGRCPNGTGASPRPRWSPRARLNNCPGDLITEAWPGGADCLDGRPGGRARR